MTMGVSEDRYTLECFPCLFILGSRYLAGKLKSEETVLELTGRAALSNSY